MVDLSDESNRSVYVTLKQFERQRPWPSYDGWRKIIKGFGDRGLRACVLRVNNRWLIDQTAFDAYMDAHPRLADPE